MPERRFTTVRDVIAAHLCTQCGACVAVCPNQAISMEESPGGMLLARVQADECVGCGSCVRVCPGVGVELGLPERVDPLQGPVARAYLARATDQAVRTRGQSGGVATALALHLLLGGSVDAMLVTIAPEDGSLRPQTIIARNSEEVVAAQGSKYFSAGSLAALGSLQPADARTATVTLPCQTQGLEKMAREGLGSAATLVCRIGLFCDRSLLRTCTDQMLRDAGVAREQAAAVRYRSKARSGWPGEVEVVLKTGEHRFFPASLRTNLKELFTPPRCRLCFDKANVFADLVLGDPWGISSDKAGDSVVVTRTSKGEALLQGARERGLITVREIPVESVFQHQGLSERRRSVERYCQLWTEMGRVPPIYDGLSEGDASQPPPSVRRFSRRLLRLNCRLAERTNPEDVARLVRRYRLSKAMRGKAARLLGLVRLR